MTVFLVTAMILLLVGVQVALALRRQSVARRATAAIRYVEAGRASSPSVDALFHPGHTWVQLHSDRLATVGASSFATNFIGDLASVRTPREGTELRQAERACTLVSKRGRELEMPMPIDGQVLAVNEDVRRDPGLLQDRPYDKGWILRIKPRRVARSVSNLAPAAAAQRWMDAARAEIGARGAQMPAATAFDGGEWARGFGERLDDRDWNALRHELFPGAGRVAEPDRTDVS